MIDAIRIVYRCALYLSATLFLRDVVPAAWSIVILLVVLGLAYLDLSKARKRSAAGLSNTLSDGSSSLHTYCLSPWLAWLALLQCPSLSVRDVPFVHTMQLEATQTSWILRKEPQSTRSVISGLLVILILANCFAPLFLFILVRGNIVYILFFLLLTSMLIWRGILQHFLRESYTDSIRFGEVEQKLVQTYITYVPQMRTPAFTYRSWRGYKVYLDARMVYQLPQTSVAVLQAHEQGHIAQRHTDIAFYLSLLRVIAVLGALLLLAFFHTQVAQWTGPLAALFGLIFVAFLLAPEFTLFIFRSSWEKAADHWAARHVGQQALRALRVGLQVNKYYE